MLMNMLKKKKEKYNPALLQALKEKFAKEEKRTEKPP